MNTAKTMDEFIASYPDDVQAILQKVRQTIQKAAPDAQEKIAYGIPTFTFHGNLIHFAPAKAHLGLYPGSEAVEVFAKELKAYDTSKGTIRFPLDKPIPYDLITKITKYRVEKVS